METRAGYVMVGGFVILLFCAGIFGAILLGDVRLDQETRPFRIYFDDSVSGLSSGAAVRYRGVPVGSVSDIRIDPHNLQRIAVTIEVDAEVPVKKDMVAVLESQGLTGIGYVEIQGGSMAAADLEPSEPGDVPIIPARPSTLQQVFETAPEIADQMVILMARAESFLSPANEQAFAQILSNLATVSGALSENAAQIDRVIASTAGAAEDIRGATREVLPLVESLRKEVTQISEETKLTLATLRGTISGLDGEVTGLTRSLTQTSRRVDSAVREVENLIVEMEPGIKDFTQTGLYELTQFLVEARVLVSNLDQLTRQLNRDPSQFLFGDQEGQVEAQ